MRAHPAAVQHRLLLATVPALLRRVTLTDTAATRNPTKRRAAMVRWTREAERREARARSFEDPDDSG